MRLALALGIAVALAAAGWAGEGRACNACREDKVAATYDWQVIRASRKCGHVVIFTTIRGPLKPDDAALSGAIARRVSATPGVDPGTVRVSLSPPAVSFACDPRRSPAAGALQSVNRRLRPLRIELAIVQVGASAPASAPAAAAAVSAVH